MFITSPKRKNGSTVVRLVRSFRQEGKTKQRIIKTLGQSKDPAEIQYFKQLAFNLKTELETGIKPAPVTRPIPFNVRLSCIQGEKRINQGVQDILGSIYSHLGFDKIISGHRKDKQWNNILKYCLFTRFLEPSSKLRSVYLIQEHFQKKILYDQILRMMDHLLKQEEYIKGHLFQKVREKSESLELLLFDVTTLYFENVTQTDLKEFGFSKDNKFNEVQIVLALLTDGDGLPLFYELFPGNTAETKTLFQMLSKLQRCNRLKKFRLTADRAMYSNKNLSYFEKRKGYEYIVSCPLRKLSDKLKEKILDRRNYKAIDESRSFFEFSYEGRRYVVGYCCKRADNDRHKRERLLEKIKKMADRQGKIAFKKLSSQKGISQYLEKVKGYVRINEARVMEEEKWDGIFGVCTNIKKLTGQELFSSYKRLWKIEESFRINKHTLQMRPIYHQLSRRIKGHIMICFLTYTLLRYLEIRLRSKGLFYSPESLTDILSGVEKWLIKDKQKERWYVIPKALSKEGRNIYKAFDIKRSSESYQLSPEQISQLNKM